MQLASWIQFSLLVYQVSFRDDEEAALTDINYFWIIETLYNWSSF